MSTAFTVPTGEVLQSLPFWNQIQLAYSERRQALGQAAATLFVENAYWQDLSMFQTWQNWLEANCTSFIDHVNGPLSDDKTAFRYWTLSTWRAASGINASGFSRHDMYGNLLGYGIAQEDDAVVANVITELQEGFSNLSHTIAIPAGCTLRSKYPSDGAGYGGATWADAKLNAEQVRASSDFIYQDFPGSIYHFCYTDGDASFLAKINSTSLKVQIESVPSHVARAAKVYAIAALTIVDPDPAKQVFDANGFPEVEENCLSLCGTALESSDATIETEWLGLIDPAFATWCEEPTLGAGWSARGYTQIALVADTGAVIDWSFTNINP